MAYVGIRNNGTENPIKFCEKFQKSFTETFALIRTAYGDDVFRTSVHMWFKRFKDGRSSIEDDETCKDNGSYTLNMFHLTRQSTLHFIWVSWNNLWPVSVAWSWNTKNPGAVTLARSNNAKPHTAHIIQQYLTKNQITVLNHLSYSPDLAPPDFFLFPKVKCTTWNYSKTVETTKLIFLPLKVSRYRNPFR